MTNPMRDVGPVDVPQPFQPGGVLQAPHRIFPLTTTDATVTVLISRAVPINTLRFFELRVKARRIDGGAVQSGGWVIMFGASNDDGVVTFMVAGGNFIFNRKDDATWAITWAPFNNGVQISVAGANGKTIQWSGTLAEWP